MEWRIILLVLPTLFALTCGDMVGGFTEVDLQTNEGAQRALDKAVEEYNKRRNCMYLSAVQEVKKVEVQVVEGTIYRITVLMAETKHKKGSSPEKFIFSDDPAMAQPYECTFRVWLRPWLKENHTIVKFDCPKETV